MAAAIRVSLFAVLCEMRKANCEGRTLALGPAELVDKKYVGEKSANVNRRVEIVDELRTDAALTEYQPDSRLRCRGVALEDLKEAVNGCLGTDALRQRIGAVLVGDSGERMVEAFEERAQLAA